MLLAPLFLVVALLIKIDSPGPVFFRQVRVGKDGTHFSIWKFRSMVDHAESSGPGVTVQGDPQITRVGGVLRARKIDELPQLLNVLGGSMSLVGPRPERPEFVAQLEREIPFYRTRLLVRPGLTGWAQVNHPYGDSVRGALEKLEYDLYYVKHRSLFFDLWIVVRTVGTVLALRGR